MKFLYGSKRCALTVNSAMAPVLSAFRADCGSLTTWPARHLLDLNDDELRRLQRREADEDVDHAVVDVGLGRGFAVALHEVGLVGRLALEMRP